MSRKAMEAKKPAPRVQADSMRLDKYLKVSRIIKRRSVANDACSTGHITVNGKEAKPGTDVRVGDVLGRSLWRKVYRIRGAFHRRTRPQAGRGGHVPREGMSTWAVVVAAGRGARAGLGENKVFHRFGGVSVLTRTLRALEGSGLFDGCVLVLASCDLEAYEALCAREGVCRLVRAIAAGGRTRQASVLSGLRALPEDADIVAIHDAARPFVTADILGRSIELARQTGSGVVCVPVVDTIKQVGEDGSVRTLDRSHLRAAQTPQTFRPRRDRPRRRGRGKKRLACDGRRRPLRALLGARDALYRPGRPRKYQTDDQGGFYAR